MTKTAPSHHQDGHAAAPGTGHLPPASGPRPARVRRVFIANRGEIARRIALTAGRLGLETVAPTDRDAPPGYLCGVVTRFVRVPEESPALYLDAARMVDLALQAGCDAVHPGFGFLSENAAFAARVTAAGLTWIGPRAAAIAAMASKATARGHAERAGVPCVRGLTDFLVPDDERGDFSTLERFAAAAGYPLLLKAAFGGGGKGMRIVTEGKELRAAALRAASEARSSFGNGSLICEQYLEAPRHVEVQILADQHGRVVAVGDRDCSLQRRHQKVIEEAPAPTLGVATRRALHAAAIQLAAAVGYDSTGTVEFLVDWSEASRRSPEQRFYFLEMNTRLQVEHPVTEEVFGLDLVEWQLRVAQGEPLPEAFLHLAPRGHSVEARLYAEDVRRQFLPSPGVVAAFRPAVGPGLRWEVGLDEVDEVTGRFDPMVAKLVATGADRAQALARLADGLARTVLAGPPTNVDLIRQLVTRSAFAEGPVTTHFLGQELAALVTGIEARLETHAGLATRLLSELAAGRLDAPSPESGTDPETLTQSVFATSVAVQATPAAAAGAPLLTLTARTVGRTATGTKREAVSGSGIVTGADAIAWPFWYAAVKSGGERRYWVAVAGNLYHRLVERATGPAPGAKAAGGTAEVLAPVPGKVVAVMAAPGEHLETGQTIVVLESMKMEFEVKAAKAGVLGAVSVKAGEQVTAGQKLAIWAD